MAIYFLKGSQGLPKHLQQILWLAPSIANSNAFNLLLIFYQLISLELLSINPKDGSFEVKKGPVFTNILLADEINRAPSKVQSALLEVMQEKQVTIGGETFPAPHPFLVIATQNPIEQEGTYPLAEAQTDRFMMKIKIYLSVT